MSACMEIPMTQTLLNKIQKVQFSMLTLICLRKTEYFNTKKAYLIVWRVSIYPDKFQTVQKLAESHGKKSKFKYAEATHTKKRLGSSSWQIAKKFLSMTLDSFKLKLEKARNFYLKKTLSEQNLSKKDWMSYCQRKIFSSSKFLEEVQNKIVRGMILKINSFVVWSNKTWSMTNFTSMKDKLNLNIQTKMRESPSLMEWKLQLKKFVMKY